MKKELIIPERSSIDALCQAAIELVRKSRNLAVRQINSIHTATYFVIGKWIVETQQNGTDRAQYGKQIVKTLSKQMTAHLGKGFSESNLEYARKFYLIYKDRISQTLSGKFDDERSETFFEVLLQEKPFRLSWSHYIKLMCIKNENERHFYELEALANNWSLSELKRQYNSALYQRLLLSTDKAKVKSLAEKGQLIEQPKDIVKDPYILEFLGLDEKSEYSETDLESRILDNLQKFLLELGKGYTFVARQQRFTFDEDHFRVDLVFYNRLLQCFVLFDLKTGKLKHQDLGQMQMYVNYYDRFEKQDFENPTIGILLCEEKNDAIVELTLPQDSNIYASKYELYLPDKKLLQRKLQEWIDEESGGEEV